MRLAFRRLVQRFANDRGALLGIDLSTLPRPWRIFLDAGQSTLSVTLPPSPSFLSRDAHQLADLLILQSVSRVQHNRRTLRQPNSDSSSALELFELPSLRIAQ